MLSDEEEQIVVTRPEDQRDPEADADFDRELAKMMADSVESRKFDRKPIFDVPLPMRRGREVPSSTTEELPSQDSAPAPSGPGTMKFALLSKRGNRQQARAQPTVSLMERPTNASQTRAIDLPSDSTFAVAMRTQQQAERAEQQRIKNLVLNYDLRDDDASDGGSNILQPNTNRKSHRVARDSESNHVQRNLKPQQQSVEFNNLPAKKMPLAPSSEKLNSLTLHRVSDNHEKSKSSVTKPAANPANPSLLSYASLVASSRKNVPTTGQNSRSNTFAGRNINRNIPPNGGGRGDSQSQSHPSTKTTHADENPVDTATLEMQSPYSQPRIDKSGQGRGQQRARKLQLSDVDWYVSWREEKT